MCVIYFLVANIIISFDNIIIFFNSITIIVLFFLNLISADMPIRKYLQRLIYAWPAKALFQHTAIRITILENEFAKTKAWPKTKPSKRAR